MGKAANDLGMQCGGWTIDWQGESGNVTPGGTTLLNAIRKTVTGVTKVTYAADATGLKNAEAVVVVVGEQPYAEMKGDRTDLRLPATDLALIKQARATGKPVVTILLSGRPMVLGSALTDSDAFIAAWLPGTEGLGVTDVLFGDFKPTGKLPQPRPSPMRPGKHGRRNCSRWDSDDVFTRAGTLDGQGGLSEGASPTSE